jgi:hypothetical protein
MLKFSHLAGIVAAAALVALTSAAPAQAQASRTWISGVGDDVNPCSRTAPCKTFAGAISKTAAGGEIDCLDPGGFGAVTVTKSITLDCGGGIGGQVGSILASGTNGVTVNAANGLVKVRNMSINGFAQGTGPGLSGIRFIQGSALIVEHVGIFSMGGTSGTNGGVSFEPGNQVASNAGKLFMLDVELQNGLADGVLVHPQNGGSATATLNHVTVMNNGGAGLNVSSISLTSGTGSVITVVNSEFSGNANGIQAVTPPSTAVAVVNMTGSVASQNGTNGVIANGATATIRLGGNTISANPTGLALPNSGTVKSYGDNYFIGNTADGTPTPTNLTKL